MDCSSSPLPLAGCPREKAITYHAPFDNPDREADYAEARAFFERETR